MTALLAKAVALALAKHPVVNACCKDGKSFTYNQDINIAVAVAMDGGLLTPVLPNADKVKYDDPMHQLRKQGYLASNECRFHTWRFDLAQWPYST
jgi:hypothetical protein